MSSVSYNVIIAGNNRLAVDCLDYFLNQKDVFPIAILNPNDTGEDTNSLSLKKHAIRNNVPIIQPNTINSTEVENILRKFKPHLILSCSYAKILRGSIIEIPKYCLNFHYSLLPKYRGCMPLINSLANAEEEVGVTLHKIFPGIDNGDILDQTVIKIDDYITMRDLYGRCNVKALELLQKWWPRIKREEVIEYKQQLNENSSYYSSNFPNNRWINWESEASRIAHFINALTNGTYPAARTVCSAGEIEIQGLARVVGEKSGKPGEVIIKDDVAVIAATDGGIVFNKIRYRDKEFSAGEILRNGEILISPVEE